MSTKQDIRSNIDTSLADGQRIPLSTNRNVLKNDSENLLDNLYPSYGTDTDLTQSVLQLSISGSCGFAINYSKQGRFFMMNGIIKRIQQQISKVGDIIVPEYYNNYLPLENGDRNFFHYGVGVLTRADSSIEPCQVQARCIVPSGTSIYVNPTLEIGDTLEFCIIWLTDE